MSLPFFWLLGFGDQTGKADRYSKEQRGVGAKLMHLELPSKQCLSVAVWTLVWFIPLTHHTLTFQQFVNKRCMTYSDLGASKKTQCCGLLIEQAFNVHILYTRYVHLTENINIKTWSFSLRILQFKVGKIFVDGSST